MPRRSADIPIIIPGLEQTLYSTNNDELKWYAASLPGPSPTRKADLVAKITGVLGDLGEVRRLWEALDEGQRQVVKEVAYTPTGQYDAEAMAAKYPQVPPPVRSDPYAGGHYLGPKRDPARPYDLFFYFSAEAGQYIPPDLAVLLRTLAPPPAPLKVRSQADPPTIAPQSPRFTDAPEVFVTETEAAAFHDLQATLDLVGQGKVGVGASTRLPTLATLRLLRERLLIGDYFAEDSYGRAEDAMRPLALVVLVQAAKWATPAGATGNKLELSRSGQAVLAAGVGAPLVREAWTRWLKSDILDELSRIRAIKGQQSKDVRLTKPATRRESLVAGLAVCPVGRWVTCDEFLRYLRAEGRIPAMERNPYSGLYLGESLEYGWLGYAGVQYWDVVSGSYLRALIWEYAATLGLVALAYTRPEDSPHNFGELYGTDERSISRYDGLLGLRLTNLGAYVLELTPTYTPSTPAVPAGPPLLKVLPNLDLVITDARRALPNDRAFLARIATAGSEDVYRLNRDLILDGLEQGLSLQGIEEFLTARSGTAAADLPQTVRVFLADIGRRLDALQEGPRMRLITGADPYLLTELANDPALRALVQLAQVGERKVLLVPDDQEAAVRRQLKKLGYLPGKGAGA